MKSKKKMLTAATLSAFLSLGGVVMAQDTGGDKAAETGKKPGKVHTYRSSGKKGHKHKHRRHSKKGGGTSTTTPPPK